MLVALLILLAQDPADQLRRQELALRLSELADADKLDGFARAVQYSRGGSVKNRDVSKRFKTWMLRCPTPEWRGFADRARPR